MTGALPTPLRDLVASFTAEQSYATLAGNDAEGFNGCTELCDRHVGANRIALRWLSAGGGEIQLSFEELQRRASRFAALLAERGAKPGDRIAGLLPRRPELLTVLLGTLRAGCVYQPLFTAFGPKAVEARVSASAPVLIVTDAANRPKLDGLDIAPILVTDQPDGAESFAQAMDAAGDLAQPVRLPADAPMLMMFTSGTTGTPKGVLVPIHMLRGIHSYLRFAVGLRDGDRFWNLADPGWAYGLYYGLCGPLFLGQAATMSEAAFSVERCYEVIERFGITSLAGAPTAFRAMAASGIAAPTGLRAISSAGEPLDGDTKAWLESHFGCPARDHWGQTELGMVIGDHHAAEHPRRAGVLGYPMPGWSAAALAPDGTRCAPGEPGALAIDRRSPLFWFGGYAAREEQPFSGDYYLTGDSVAQDADGAIHFIGRDDDVITSSGYRIGPSEVESALIEHPQVLEAAVIGRPDPVRTEIVKAFVTLKGGASPTDELARGIGAFVKTRLAAHAYPREIAFVDELPKTPSGKIQRHLLRGAKGAALEIEPRPASQED